MFMRHPGRQRKLFKLFVSTVFVCAVYIITSRREQINRIRCVRGFDCPKDQLSHQSARRNLDDVRDDSIRTRSSKSPFNDVVTKPIHPGILVYNRVPKCASSTLRHLISNLQKRNRFRYEIHNWPNVKQSLTKQEEERLVKQVSSLPQPLLFLRHLHFVDFETFNVTRPAYINMIRNPVDRFVSHYYFSRFGFVNWTDDKIKKWLWPMSEERRRENLDECVERIGGKKCVEENKENLLEFFCGQDDRCRKHDDWALAKAKENIAKNFVFIGVLEKIEDSIEVAETILPKYFRGAKVMFQNSPRSGSHTKTARKVEPSETTRLALQVALHREIELYNFVLDRLNFQIQKLKENGNIT